MVVVTVEKWVFAENHGSQHAPETPHIQRVVVVAVIYQEFRSFKVPGGHPHVVLLPGMVELSQTPIYQPNFSVLQIHNQIMRF